MGKPNTSLKKEGASAMPQSDMTNICAHHQLKADSIMSEEMTRMSKFVVKKYGG